MLYSNADLYFLVTNYLTFTRTLSETTTSSITSYQTKNLTLTSTLPATAYSTSTSTILTSETSTIYMTKISTILSTSYSTTVTYASVYKTAVTISTTTSIATRSATITATSTITQSCCIPTPTLNPSPANANDVCGKTGTWTPSYSWLNYYNTTASGTYGCAELCLNDEYCYAFAVASASDTGLCELWGAETTGNGFKPATPGDGLRYYDVDCFSNQGCAGQDTCPGYVEGNIYSYSSAEPTGYYYYY